ncbi:MAG: anti-sigma B factor antagonist [Bacteriovoracaceae bacterium]|jgi:anti-sigma B factor antagonist
MEGGLDFENSMPFKRELEGIAKDNPTCQITLDLNRLDFVGSSGIGYFVETIKSLNDQKDQIRLSNVRTEFLKVFKLYDLDLMSLMIEEFDRDETEGMSQMFANRKNTYQN